MSTFLICSWFEKRDSKGSPFLKVRSHTSKGEPFLEYILNIAPGSKKVFREFASSVNKRLRIKKGEPFSEYSPDIAPGLKKEIQRVRLF